MSRDEEDTNACDITNDSAPGLPPPTFVRNRPNKPRHWSKTTHPRNGNKRSVDQSEVYLGTSSTVSFTIRAAAMVRKHIQAESVDLGYELSLDGDAYKIHWSRASPKESPDVSNLPPVDYAVYLARTVSFRVGSTLKIFDEEDFFRQLEQFYQSAQEKARLSRLWYCQYLLMLAFGEGCSDAGSERMPATLPGSRYFCRAMEILPEIFMLYKEPILAAEVLTSVALYLACLDMRQSAYSYIGQAARIALAEGMHTPLSAEVMGSKMARRCKNIWWTICILDSSLSVAVGAPMSVNEHYFPIGSPLSDQALGGVVLSLHVNLARLMSTLMADLYVADGSLEASYLSKITQGLVKLAAFADQLDRTVKERLTSSVGSLPKGATQLRLLHHQCVMLTTKPLLLSILQRLLKSPSSQVMKSRTLSAPLQSPLKTCADAACQSVDILESLRRLHILGPSDILPPKPTRSAHAENLADTFLPFDLEYCFSAASVLVLLDDVLHCTAVEGGAKDLALQLLEDMASRGSAPAKFRRAQLERLRVASKHFWEDAERRERHHVVTQTAANTSGSACATTQEPHRRISPSTSTNPIQLASVSGARQQATATSENVGLCVAANKTDERPTHQYPAEELMAQGQVIQCPDLEPNGMSSLIDEIFVDDALPEFDLFATYGDWMSTDAL